jgi:hypothetical protein
MTTGEVTLTVIDNGGEQVTVPSSSVQVIIGCSSAGTAYQPFATRSQSTIESVAGFGPLLEASCLTINGAGNGLPGGTAIICKVPPNTKGNTAGVLQKMAVASSAIAYATGVNTVTAAGHGFVVGEVVVVTDGMVAGNAGTFIVTSVPTSATFTYADAAGANSTTATMVTTGIIYLSAAGTVSSGTLVPTLSLDATNGAWDDFFVQWTFLNVGTIGTTGLQFTLSGDANRNTGPALALGTALSYTIPNTGITIDFTTAQTVKAGDTIRFATIGPQFSDANINTALLAIQASPYANAGWTGGTWVVGRSAGSDVTTVSGYVETLANGYLFTRGIYDARDAKVPLMWGGPGETETAWLTAIEADFAAVGQRRACVNGGYYNIPSPTSAQSPAIPTISYRRGLAWAIAPRVVGLPPERNEGAVIDGPLATIVVSAGDPTDGFVYHDEYTNPSLLAARFSCATTRRPNFPGYYCLEPSLMSPAGSQFGILPQGLVIDKASSLFVQELQLQINSDVRTNPNGTIYENDAKNIEQFVNAPIEANMVNSLEISGNLVVVDRMNNVLATNNLNVSDTVQEHAYIESVTATIGLASATP